MQLTFNKKLNDSCKQDVLQFHQSAKHSYRYIVFDTNNEKQKIISLFSIKWKKHQELNKTRLSFMVSASFCAPGDTFSKEMARNIADKRLENVERMHFVTGNVDLNTTEFQHILTQSDFNQVLDYIYNCSDMLSHTVSKAFKRKKFKYSLKTKFEKCNTNYTHTSKQCDVTCSS